MAGGLGPGVLLGDGHVLIALKQAPRDVRGVKVETLVSEV